MDLTMGRMGSQMYVLLLPVRALKPVICLWALAGCSASFPNAHCPAALMSAALNSGPTASCTSTPCAGTVLDGVNSAVNLASRTWAAAARALRNAAARLAVRLLVFGTPRPDFLCCGLRVFSYSLNCCFCRLPLS